MSHRRGDKIGPYFLLDKLGRGGFGEVWLAEKRTSLATTRFALKLPNDEVVDLDKIRAEAEVWCSISGHPNILPIIDADVYDEQVVIVSEYIQGGSLADWLKRNNGKTQSIDSALQMLRGILDGLEFLHSRRVVHRDLKPQNILLQEGIPRLADFGISKVLRDEASSTQQVSGTIAYMPPEAFEGKRSFQTDLWSVGVVFYQMLSGHLPFDQKDHLAMMRAIIDESPAELSREIPPQWRQFINRALSKDLTRRFQTATEMKRAYDATLRGHSLADEDFAETRDLAAPTLRMATKDLAKNQSTLRSGAKNSVTNQFDAQTINENVKQETHGAQSRQRTDNKRFGWVAAALFLLTFGVGAMFLVNYLKQISPQQQTENPNTNGRDLISARQMNVGKKYLEMSDNEKLQFVATSADIILRSIQSGGESDISASGISAIKAQVDHYEARRRAPTKDSCGNQTFDQSDLATVLKRGAKIAPEITAGFKEKEISPVVGIYMAMIESEFCPCLSATNGYGGLGIYQFSTAAAVSYGLKAVKGSTADNPDERCNPEPASQVAAIYVKKLMAEDFGDGANQTTFAIAAFNAGEDGLRSNINLMKKLTQPETMSFWTLLENKNKLSEQFQIENSRYLTKFFAAAIIGENPQAFGINVQPLSSYAK